MSETQDKVACGSSRVWSLARRLVVLVLVMFVLGTSVLRGSQTVGTNDRPVGFLYGVFHGALMPCALPALLFGHDVTIYAPNNNGHGYKLGYTLGVNGCGLIFFGFFFWRVARLRKRMADGKGRDPSNKPA